MRLRPVRIDVLADPSASVAVDGDGSHVAGPLEVTVHGTGSADVTWSVANCDDASVKVRAVRLVFVVDGTDGPLRCFRHGYQSWSPSGVAVLGVDGDPSLSASVPRLVRDTHHADGDVAEAGELRSEMVTVLADGGPERTLAGFLGGDTHDGTWRLRQLGGSGTGRSIELAAEAFLGGVQVDPGVERQLHPLTFASGEDASALLEQWADQYGGVARARTSAAYQVGWCSWYHYFGAVTEADVRANLSRADAWPFDVFQVDDGFQAAIGDWLTTDASFPSPLDELAGAIAAAGRRPGLWIAPFLAMPDSAVATAHPDWLARWDDANPLMGMYNPAWGGAASTLDTTRPDVLAHLESLGRDLFDAGFTYLKLDFTYAPALQGRFHDPTQTPAERVRAGYDAIRRGAGEDAFILGCGAPFGAVAGVVDGNRIGADVAPHWHVQDEQRWSGDYADGFPATVNAWAATLARSFLHRKLWVNDPDCLMLRLTDTALSPDAVQAWANAVALSGGMALVSDDLALLDARAHQMLDDVVTLGRQADADAIAERPPRCPDLLDHPVPERFAAAGRELIGDPSTGTSILQ